MRRSAIFLVALGLSSPLTLLPLSAVCAQSDAQSGVVTAQQSSTSGTAPEHMGSGGHTGADTGNASAASSHENINHDSTYASGEDLRGPAVHFPATKTPE